MSAVTASLAPRSTARHHHRIDRRSASVGVRGARAMGQLPTRYTVPASVLPSRSTFVRRRVGAVVFVVALVLSVGSVAQRGLAGYAPTYVVRPGDTMWGIAEDLYPGADIARIVDALVSLNGGAAIEAGQTLNLP